MRLICLLFVAISLQAALHPFGKGLKAPTKEEKQNFETLWKAEGVLPNKIGVARMKHAMSKQGPMDEIEIATSYEEEFGSVSAVNPANLPRYVDNSKLPSFPPIGNQGPQGSCVAWGTTYYQATHEIGLANGINNKGLQARLLSPKWTYNMINFGQDAGAYFSDAYYLLSQNGAALLSDFPYDPREFLAWDLLTEDWVEALSNRLTLPKAIGGLDGQPQNLTRIKTALANGHVLTFGTFIDSWQFARIKSNPAGDNRFVGEWAGTWVNGTLGAHCMTIVGYNDDLWIDVNGNGQVDPGEMGAFLVANSWGRGWANRGFIWISYDAFLSESQVQDGPTGTRVPAADATSSYCIAAHAKTPHYSPSLVMQFDVSQTQRDKIKVAAAVSDPSSTVPTRYFLSGALFFQGGEYGFNGTALNMPMSGSFCIDLTDLAFEEMQKRYYFIVRNDSEVPTLLNSYSLMDLKNGTVIPGDMMVRTVEKGRLTQHIDYTQPTSVPPETSSTGLFSYPEEGNQVQGLVPVIIKTSCPDDCVELYVDGQLVGKDSLAPYFFMVDTEELSNGNHQFSAFVHNKNNSDCFVPPINVNVQN